MTWVIRVICCVVIVLPLLGLLLRFPSAANRIDDNALRSAHHNPSEWISHGRDYAETRFSPLAEINVRTVAALHPDWSFDTESMRGVEATPIVVGSALYTTGAWSIVFALDSTTGEELWRWDPQVPRSYQNKVCCDVVNRGVAVYGANVYVATLDGRLVALDRITGKPLWQTLTVDASQPYTITGAPRIVKGKVIIGNGGADFGVRGYVSAYDATTGKLVWRFYTVPGDPAKEFESPAMAVAAKSWTGRWWTYGGGGTVWDSIAFDPALDLLFVGTGNGSPWNQSFRSPDGGDNLFLSSILALRPDTGELVWHYQTTPGESWDFTATQHMILARLTVAGRQRNVLMQAPKNGFFYVLDRSNGQLISAQPYADINWASHVDLTTGRPVETGAARYEVPTLIRPGPLGSHSWQPMSFNPLTGLVYIPALNSEAVYADDPGFGQQSSSFNTGVNLGSSQQIGMSRKPQEAFLLAWDPVSQEERWRVTHGDVIGGGTLTTAGLLVFQGTRQGTFSAYSADTGRKLWTYQLDGPIVAPPITYRVKGLQRIAVMTTAGRTARGHPISAGKLVTFALKHRLNKPNR